MPQRNAISIGFIVRTQWPLTPPPPQQARTVVSRPRLSVRRQIKTYIVLRHCHDWKGLEISSWTCIENNKSFKHNTPSRKVSWQQDSWSNTRKALYGSDKAPCQGPWPTPWGFPPLGVLCLWTCFCPPFRSLADCLRRFCRFKGCCNVKWAVIVDGSCWHLVLLRHDVLHGSLEPDIAKNDEKKSNSQDTQPISRDLYNDHKAHKHFFSSTWAKCKSPISKMIYTSHGSWWHAMKGWTFVHFLQLKQIEKLFLNFDRRPRSLEPKWKHFVQGSIASIVMLSSKLPS